MKCFPFFSRNKVAPQPPHEYTELFKLYRNNLKKIKNIIELERQLQELELESMDD
jgi:hypothetical protein